MILNQNEVIQTLLTLVIKIQINFCNVAFSRIIEVCKYTTVYEIGCEIGCKRCTFSKSTKMPQRVKNHTGKFPSRRSLEISSTQWYKKPQNVTPPLSSPYPVRTLAGHVVFYGCVSLHIQQKKNTSQKRRKCTLQAEHAILLLFQPNPIFIHPFSFHRFRIGAKTASLLH